VNRTEKTALVDELHATFRDHPHVILAAFAGLSSNLTNELRRKIGGAGGSYRVIQNRLARRAAAGTPAEQLGPQFRGPCAVLAHKTDAIALAKVLADFTKANPQIQIVAGVIDAHDLAQPATIRALATMPGLPQLRAQLLALVQTPATMLVRLLGTPPMQVARVIQARSEAGTDADATARVD
jgi:large subunit ribosomal protein L10